MTYDNAKATNADDETLGSVEPLSDRARRDLSDWEKWQAVRDEAETLLYHSAELEDDAGEENA